MKSYLKQRFYFISVKKKYWHYDSTVITDCNTLRRLKIRHENVQLTCFEIFLRTNAKIVSDTFCISGFKDQRSKGEGLSQVKQASLYNIKIY